MKRNIWEIPVLMTQSAEIYDPPDHLIAESEKNENYYLQCLRYYTKYYNKRTNALITSSIGGNEYRPMLENPCNFMVRMLLYYMGEQPNMNFSHVTQNSTQNNIQAVWIKGHKMAELANNIRGQVMARIGTGTWDAYPVSPDETTKEETLRQMAEAQFYQAMAMEELKQKGVEFDPTKGQVQFPEEIEEWAMLTNREKNCEIYSNLSNGIYFEDMWNTKLRRAFLNLWATSIVAMEMDIRNNKIYSTLIEPYHYLRDTRIDSDYGMYDEFRGWVKPMAISEIIRKYPQIAPYKAELYELAKSNKNREMFNVQGLNFLWWPDRRDMVTVAKVYFRGFDTQNYNKYESRIGKNPRIAKPKPDEFGSYPTDRLYQATIIGNKWLVDYGVVENNVEDIANPAKLAFPIQHFVPNMFMGESISEAHRLHLHQDELDYLTFKINEMVGQAKGRKYIIYSNKFNNAPKEFFDQIATMGIVVDKKVGDADDPMNAGKDFEMIDWTLDPNIDKLRQLYMDIETRMQDIASTSSIGLGQQDYYIGLAAQNNTIQRNQTGISYLVDGFIDWVVMCMRYAGNKVKNYHAVDETSNYRTLIGDRGIKTLSFEKGMMFEQMFVKLVMSDIADDAQKVRIQTYLQAAAQNPAESGVKLLDILKIEKEKNLTNMVNELETTLMKREKEKMNNEAANQEMAKAIQDERNQLTLMLEELKQENANMRSLWDNWTKAMTSGVQFAPDMAAMHQMAESEVPDMGQGQPEGGEQQDQPQQAQMEVQQ
jgi:hypothetical protein